MQVCFKDQIGRVLVKPKKITKIISLVPSQTELLVDLGLEDYIVGITKFCIHPKHLKTSKKVVGGTKTISLEKIKALNPDIILCNKEENTQQIVEELEKSYTVHVSNINTINDSLNLIIQYGSLFNCTVAASRICANIKNEVLSFKSFIKDKPNKDVVYFIWKNPWMTIGKDTFIHHLLSFNNYSNIYKNQKRYPKVTLEEVKKKSPELILLSSEPFPFKEIHCKEIQKQFPNSKVLLVDGEYFSWYGSRLQKAFAYFKSLHY